MKKEILFTLMLSLLSAMTASAQTTETIYSWESPSGTVVEAGGTIVQHNAGYSSRINYLSSGYYTIQLCGKKENMMDTDNSLNSVYFTITLDTGMHFKSGDKIEIVGMRNNDDGGKSNIHFVYGALTGTASDITYDDTNTWNNLGRMHEVSIGGGTLAKGVSPESSQGEGMEVTDSGTDPLKEGYSLVPSTYTFTIPAEADGTSALTLTRNESECKLYVTKILVTGPAREKVYPRGDVNQDGVVNISDVNAVISIMCGGQ